MRTLYGRRVGVMTGLCLATIVLIANIGLLIHGAIAWFKGGVASLVHGDSSRVSTYNMVYHCLINFLSTLLFSTSNYTMQVLNAPTREEADYAHAYTSWVEVGTVSLRNLRFMTWK